MVAPHPQGQSIKSNQGLLSPTIYTAVGARRGGLSDVVTTLYSCGRNDGQNRLLKNPATR